MTHGVAHRLAFRALRRARYRACLDQLVPGARTLWDVGCGDESFVALARARGLAARGSDLETDITTAPIQADIVTCFETLEHVADPVAAMRALGRAYRMQLLITVPYEPWFSLYRLSWEPEHLWAVTPAALRHHLGPPAFEQTLVFRRYYLASWLR